MSKKINSTDGSEKPKKKSALLVAIACTAILPAILLLILLAPRMKDVFFRTEQSPEEYFTSLARTEISKTAGEFKTVMGWQESINSDKAAYDSNISITLGDYVKQLLSAQNISFDKVTATMSTDMADNKMQITGMLGLNSTDLLSYECLYDNTNKTFFFKLPELSEAYLKYSLYTSLGEEDQRIVEAYTAMSKLITGSNIERLLVNYGNVVLDHVGKVTLVKNQTVTVNNKKAVFNKLTVDFSEKELTELLIAVLEKAATDDTLKEMSEFFSVMAGETNTYSENISSKLDELKRELETAGNETMVRFILYANGNTVTGWTLRAIGGNDNFSMEYLNLFDHINGTSTIKIIDNGIERLNMLCEYQKAGDGFTGNMNLAISLDDLSGDVPVTDTKNFKIRFSDAAFVNKEAGILKGTFNFSTDESIGIAMKLIASGDKDSQNMEFSLLFMEQLMYSMKADRTKRELNVFTMPSESDNMYNIETQLEEYAATLDISSLINNLSQTGLDISSLLGLDNY